MKFIIRDDDLNYFSTPADITGWYADIFARGIPVGFAVIPLVKRTSDVYPNLPAALQNVEGDAGGKEFPIGDNIELVAYIKSNPLIEVLQHGTTHETKNGAFEYAGRVPRAEATRGKAELERALGYAPRVFVPPHDWINSQGVLSVEAAGMDIIRGRGAGLRNWLWRWHYAAVFVRMLGFKLFNAVAYPYVLNFGKHKEICSYRLEDTDVFEGLAYAHKKDGVFVVVTHVHSLTEEKKMRLLKLIEQARSLNVQFVLPSAIF